MEMNLEQTKSILGFLLNDELHKKLNREEAQEVFDFLTNFNLHRKVNEALIKKKE